MNGVISLGFWTTVNCFDGTVTAEEARQAIARSFGAALEVLSEPSFVVEMGPEYEPIRHLALGSDFDGATLVPRGADAIPWYLEGISRFQREDGTKPFDNQSIKRLAGENLYDLLAMSLERS